jgi:hypothetical protein
MKNIKLIFIIICLLVTISCTSDVKDKSLNNICYIDSASIKTSLKKIIMMYIHQYPSGKSYYLYHRSRRYYLDSRYKQSELCSDDESSYLILSSTFIYSGENNDINNQMPSCYFKLNDRIVFLASNIEFLKKMKVMNGYFKDKYASKISLKEYYNSSWLIKVSNYGNDVVVIKRNLWGVCDVKRGNSRKFKAPIILR